MFHFLIGNVARQAIYHSGSAILLQGDSAMTIRVPVCEADLDLLVAGFCISETRQRIASSTKIKATSNSLTEPTFRHR
jgi:hypothetical protein